MTSGMPASTVDTSELVVPRSIPTILLTRACCHVRQANPTQFSIAGIDAGTIDAINILQATHRAMNRALAQLRPAPQHVLVDGLRVPSLRFPQTALIQGDARSFSIAAASILAKVTRDRWMVE